MGQDWSRQWSGGKLRVGVSRIEVRGMSSSCNRYGYDLRQG